MAELGTKRRKSAGARDEGMVTQEATVEHLPKAEVTEERSPSGRDRIADLSTAWSRKTTIYCARAFCGSGIRTAHCGDGMALLREVGPPGEGSEAVGWDHLRLIHSPVWWLMLVADRDLSRGCQLEPPCLTWLPHLASSQYGGWVSKVSVPRESPWKMYHLLGPSLGKHTVRHLDGILFLGKECQHSTEGRTCGNGYVLVRSLKNTTCHKYLGTEMMARKIPATGPRRLQGGLPCT